MRPRNYHVYLPPVGSLATLLRWLGPWGGDGKPADVAREEVNIDAPTPLRAWVYTPKRAPTGVYLLLPGLHYLGPSDTRLDRFATILAASGFVVVAPFVRGSIALLLSETMFDDAEVALGFAADQAARRSLPPPALFSISFGSLLALHVMSTPSLAARVSRALLFGGYADLFPSVEYAVTGRAMHDGAILSAKRDPLNSPVIYMNLLPWLALDGDVDRGALMRAWRTMVHRTWGRMELKADGARDPHAHAISRQLPGNLRVPFLRGCGLAPGAFGWLKEGIAEAGDRLAVFDAGDRPSRVTVRTTLVHGRDDDVLPYFETLKLGARIPPASLKRTCITGLYGHTGVARPTIAAIAAEARAMHGMLSDMAG